jgi:hypothetical protein
MSLKSLVRVKANKIAKINAIKLKRFIVKIIDFNFGKEKS